MRVSQAVGRNDLKAIDRYASNGLILTTLIGAVFSLAVLIFARPIISVFNIQNVAVETYALQYLRICGGLLVVPFCINGFSAINEGLGKTKTNFRVLVVGLVMNIVLDPLFILVFRMGVNGAAIATVISQATTLAIFIVLYRTKQNRLYHIRVKAIDKDAIKDIVRIGLPSGFHSMLFTSISIFLARLIFAFGPEVMTAQRIGSQIEQFTWMIGGGFQTALTVFVGQNYGAKEFGRIRQGVKTIALMLLPYALGVGLILYFQSEWLMRIFIDDPVSIGHGKVYLRLMGYAQVFMMAEGIGAGLFNGVGLTKVPSATGIFGNVIRIPLAFLLVPSLAEIGVWWTLNISDFFKGSMLALCALILLPRLERWHRFDLSRKEKALQQPSMR